MPASRSKVCEEDLISELAKIGAGAARRRFLGCHPRLVRRETVGKLAPMVAARSRVDTQQALHLAEAALLIARRLRCKEDLALALRAKGNALHASGENRAAAEHHDRACKLFESLELWKEAARTLSSSIQPLNLIGEYDRAFAAAERAREIFARLGEPARVAGVDNNLGNVLHRQDRFEEAMACYERAYAVLSKHKQWEHVAITLHNMAMCLISLNDFPRSLDCYQKARELCVRYHMPLLRRQADYNIAYLYYLRGEYSRSIEMLLATRRLCERTGDDYHQALCHLDLSEIYLELNLVEEAREMAREAFLGFKKLGMAYEAAKALANEAIAWGQQRKAAAALECLARARVMFARERNLVWPRLLDLYQAVLLHRMGSCSDARALCSEAAEYFDGSVLTGKAALSRLLLARLALEAGDTDAAQKETQRAAAKLSHLEAPVLAYESHLLFGKIAQKRGRAAVAHTAYREAQEALEALRTGLRNEELKISFAKNRTQAYEGIVDLYFDSQDGEVSADEAFCSIEAAKSRAMLEMISQSGRYAPLAEVTRDEQARTIRSLREELNWYYHRIELEQLRPEEASRKRLEQLQERARLREKEFARALRELPSREREREFAEARSDWSLAAIQTALPAGTALVEYYSAGDRLVCAVVTRDGLELRAVTRLARVAPLLHLLRFQLSKFRLGEAYAKQFGEALLGATLGHLEELHAELVGPLPSLDRYQHLVFVPHGPLHYLPFHALFNGSEYLCDRHTVSYAPSAALFLVCQQKAPRANASSLVLGIPDERAPHILGEVQSVAALLPGARTLLGKQASAEVLRKHGPGSAVLHIATHGVYRQDNPMFSGIKLGDGYLSLFDLYQTRLGADLVTLSGCATGMNFVAEGDELLGLERGLFRAGAASLLLSLWDVHDHRTAELMQAFYRSYAVSGDAAASLGEAMRQLRDRCPHPYFWAPFVLAGKVAAR